MKSTESAMSSTERKIRRLGKKKKIFIRVNTNSRRKNNPIFFNYINPIIIKNLNQFHKIDLILEIIEGISNVTSLLFID